MHNPRLILFIALILLVMPFVSAISSIYESTSVSRIVGNSPAEMERQFSTGNFALIEAGVSDNSGLALSTVDMLGTYSFPGHFTQNPTDNWIKDTGKKLVVLDSYPYESIPNHAAQFDTKDAEDWSSSLDANPSLFIVNSEYAGLSLPKIDSIGNALSPHTAMIAPTAYTSQQFLKTIICNLGNGKRLGDIFAQTRNNYHWNIRDSNELVGLTLLSYVLYGNPLVKVTVPEYENSARDRWCKGNTEQFTLQSAGEYQIQAVGEAYTRTITFTIPSYELEDFENFTFITTPETWLQENPGEPALPVRALLTEFPLNTVVTKVELIGFSDPVEISANAPMWDGFVYADRDCSISNSSARIDFSHTYSDDNNIVLARILPVDVLDCSAGQFRLYRTTTYNITYYPFSPVRITAIDAPAKALPDTLSQITVHIENTQDEPVTGNLSLTDAAGTVLAVKEITTTQSENTLELPIPATEGTYTYFVEFIQDDEAKTRASFEVNVRLLEATLNIPEVITGTAGINVSITNNWQSAIMADITAELSRNGEQHQTLTQHATLQPGENTLAFAFEDIDRDDGAYDVLITIQFEGKTLLFSGVLLPNHAPAILNTNVVANETETIDIPAITNDLEGDEIDITIDAPFDVDGTHTLTFDESGTYPIKITADDGIAVSERTILLTVHNTNRPPELYVPEVADATEGDEFALNVTVSDPDNENCVDNDDNNLTIVYGYPLDEDGKFVPGYDSPRELNVSVTVNDDELSVTEVATVRIANTNRPPRISLPDLIASDYDIDLAPYVNVSDPDNENDDPSDDNQLSIIYAQPFDSNGRWSPPQPGLVFTTVRVTDGEFTAGKDLWINVSATHPMPQPPYTYPEYNYTLPVEEPPANITENQTQEINESAPQNQTINETATQNETFAPTTPATTITPPVITNGLEIEITAKADGHTKTLDGDTSLKVEPDSEVKLEISLKNNGNSTKKIIVEAGIDELDEEEKETVTLKPDDDEELKYEFFIPRLTDEDKYKLEIIVRENGFRQKWVLALKLDKPSHELSLRRAKAEVCDDNGRITIRLENTGSSEEKGTLHLESSSLDLDRKIQFALDEGEYKTFSEPFLVENGTHTISVTAEYNSRSITKEVPVENC